MMGCFWYIAYGIIISESGIRSVCDVYQATEETDYYEYP